MIFGHLFKHPTIYVYVIHTIYFSFLSYRKSYILLLFKPFFFFLLTYNTLASSLASVSTAKINLVSSCRFLSCLMLAPPLCLDRLVMSCHPYHVSSAPSDYHSPRSSIVTGFFCLFLKLSRSLSPSQSSHHTKPSHLHFFHQCLYYHTIPLLFFPSSRIRL